MTFARWHHLLFNSLLLFIAAPAFASAQPPAAPNMASEADVRAINDTIARQPLFAMLIEDRPAFRAEWEKRLHLRSVIGTAAAPESSVHAGLDLAMDAARPYLMRASDSASNRFLGSLAKLVAEGEKDPDICLAYVEPGGSDAGSVSRRERVESRLGKLLLTDMLQSLTEVVASGRNGEKRVLSRQELQPAIQPVIMAMVEKSGARALQDLASINNRAAPPLERCQAMTAMLDAFKVQPVARRAMLTRTLFSGAFARSE